MEGRGSRTAASAVGEPNLSRGCRPGPRRQGEEGERHGEPKQRQQTGPWVRARERSGARARVPQALHPLPGDSGPGVRPVRKKKWDNMGPGQGVGGPSTLTDPT